MTRSGEGKGENDDDNDDTNRARDSNDGNSHDSSDNPWKEVVVPSSSSMRGREWRIVVETCQVVNVDGGAEREDEEGVIVVAGSGDAATSSEKRQRQQWRDGAGAGGAVRVGMEVELMEVRREAFERG